MAEIIGDITRQRRLEILDDVEVRERLEQAIERSQARERAQSKPFSRRDVNGRLGEGAHRQFMHQQSW
jgi:regulator of sirC expression with transglutaminase-like and TPR domain